jgi:hypothetical protein
VAALVRLGLVRLVNDAVVMHRLVQAVLRDQTPEQDHTSIKSVVLDVLIAAAPLDPGAPASWPRWAGLYPMPSL